MGVSRTPSRVADLLFQVFNRGLHPDWFATRSFRRIEFQGWEADLRIIEGGHAVVFRAGAMLLTEVLSGPDSPVPETGRLFQAGLRKERSTILRPGGSIEYQSCLDSEQVDVEVFRHLSQETALDGSRNALFHAFRGNNRLLPAPVSMIKVTPRAGDLTIQSIHTFPEERAIVRTQSLFELKPAPPRL